MPMPTSLEKRISPPLTHHLWRRKNRRQILFTFYVLSGFATVVLLPFVVMPLLATGMATTPLPEYKSGHLIFTPAYQSEIWLENGELHVYGTVVIEDETGTYDRISLPSGEVTFGENGLAVLGPAHMTSGRNLIEFMNQGLVGERMPIYLEIGGAWTVLAESIWASVLSILITHMGCYAIPYFGMVHPLRMEQQMARFHVERAELGPVLDEQPLNLLLERTDKVRESLRERYHHLDDKLGRLLTGVGLLISALLALLTYVTGFKLDPALSLILSGSLLFAIFLLLRTANQLISRIDYDHRPTTRWSPEGNICPTLELSDTFEADLHRQYLAMTRMNSNDFLKDNIREIVFLYYLVDMVEERYRSALSDMRGPFYLIASGIVLYFLTSWAGMGAILIHGYMLLAIPALLIVLYRSVWGWKNEDLSLTKLTLFYHPDHVDPELEQNKGFDSVEELLAASGVIPVFTDYSTPEMLTELQMTVRKSIETSGRDPNEDDTYGPKKGAYDWCGTTVPVLLVVKHKLDLHVEVYPKRDNNRKLVTIRDRIGEE